MVEVGALLHSLGLITNARLTYTSGVEGAPNCDIYTSYHANICAHAKRNLNKITVKIGKHFIGI